MFGDSLKAGWWLDQKPGATVVPDFSGNGHDGVATDVEFGQRPLAPGMVGSSGYFDGVSGSIDIDNPLNFAHQNGELTLETVVSLDKIGEEAWWGLCGNLASFSSNTGVFWRVDSRGGDNKVNFRFQYNDGATTHTQALTAVWPGADDQPHHWLASWSDSLGKMAIYVDGEPIAEQGFALTANSKDADFNFSVGAGGGGTGKLDGGMHYFSAASQFTDGADAKLLAELSGVKNPPAYYQTGYVSEYPTSH
jgi:hypothetical protein